MIIIIMFVFLLKENNKNKIHCTAAINTDLRCELEQSSYYIIYINVWFVFCFLRAVNIVTQNASAERAQVMRTHSCVRAESILNTFGMHFLFACL